MKLKKKETTLQILLMEQLSLHFQKGVIQSLLKLLDLNLQMKKLL